MDICERSAAAVLVHISGKREANHTDATRQVYPAANLPNNTTIIDDIIFIVI
ncbi:hypothetical protein M2387_000616 [Klebsiella sp. BIGb0407]|nr:hypothetical protein [Klebsiella sp. BIGb0407]